MGEKPGIFYFSFLFLGIFRDGRFIFVNRVLFRHKIDNKINIKYLLVRGVLFVGTRKRLRIKAMLKVADSLQH
jgi:hypothetical protein